MKYLYLSEKELQTFAQKIAERITIRTYDNGNSCDVTRTPTHSEFELIYKVAYGALLAFRWRINCSDEAQIEAHLQSILDCSEFTLNQLIKNCNSYDTLYCPLKAIIRKHLVNPLHQ